MVFSRGKSTKGDIARNTYSWPNQYKGENVMYRLPTNVYYNDNIVVMEDEYAVFLRDGKMQAFAEIEQSSVLLPLEFMVEPQIPSTGYPQLVVTSAKVAGLPAPDLVIETIQQSLDEAYTIMLQNGGSTIVVQSISIADGFMTIQGSKK